MLIPVSIRNLRAAVGLAKNAANQKYEEDKAKLSEASFRQLHDGAVHNGLTPSASDLEQMRGMAERDVEHAMESHESTVLNGHYELMLQMVDYYEAHDSLADDVVISHEEFKFLKDHLNAVIVNGKKD